MVQDKKDKGTREKQPVVVLVGHIDHGKSSILEKIKDFKITEKEIGGITQSIGAYEIEHRGKNITFIDTPGHEAFSAMRARGAKIADIAILVVAADEGIKSQTKEAIKHIAKSDAVTIVALNKVDRTQAKPERVKDELLGCGVVVEDRGGDVPCIKTSTKTGKGITELLEMILLVAEMKQLKASFSDRAEGVVIESLLSGKRGPVATLLLEKGILKVGDLIAVRSSFGKIKRIEDFRGKEIKQAIPGQAVLVLGFNELPVIGEKFQVSSDMDRAKNMVDKQEDKVDLLQTIEEDSDAQVLNLILKTDVLGSIEPVIEILKKLPQEKVRLKLLKTEVGDINSSDVKFAEASEALILGFRVGIGTPTVQLAERKRINIISVDLVYDLVEAVKKVMMKSLSAEIKRIDLGKLKVLLIFKTDKKRQVVGARVLDGEITKGAKIEVVRDDEAVGVGKVVGLQKEKKELKKGIRGDEVGILYEGNANIQEGDVLITYEQRKEAMSF